MQTNRAVEQTKNLMRRVVLQLCTAISVFYLSKVRHGCGVRILWTLL